MITRDTFDKFLMDVAKSTLSFRRKIVLIERAIKKIKNEHKRKTN
jgi:hypothetical protein